MRQTRVDRVLAFTGTLPSCFHLFDWSYLEFTHTDVHTWVGGDMYNLSTSANDPTFFLHHAFVDAIWEKWRIKRQRRSERESDYPPIPPHCAGPEHHAEAEMSPFG
jgi:tyrosinase